MSDLSELTSITPAEAVALGAGSLTTYGKLFFPRTFRQKSPEMHEAVGKALYSHSRFNAFEMFRGSAKTSLTRVYTSQRIAYAISRTVMIVSVSQGHAMFSVRWLRRQVMYNKKWAETFGLKPGKKWTDEWCEIECHLVEDPYMPGTPVIITVLAVGITGQIRGFNLDDFRPDLIVADDILNDENTATDEQLKKIEMLFFGALINSLSPASETPLAKAVLLQTPMNRRDVVEKCMADPQWNGVRYGILDYSNPEAPAGVSRWEERYPTAQVLKDKEAATRRSQYRLWMQEQECMLVTSEEKALDIGKLKMFDTLPTGLDVVISLDPASSDSKTADNFAIGAVGMKGMDVYLLDYTATKGVMPDKASNDTFNLALLYHPRKFVVESVSYQRIMAWYLEQEMTKRRMFYAVERLQVKGQSNADRIMQTLPGLLAFGHLHCRPHHTSFIAEMDDYDPSVKNIKDDILTMLANAIISLNPAMRSLLVEDAEGRLMLPDEDEYKPLVMAGCP